MRATFAGLLLLACSAVAWAEDGPPPAAARGQRAAVHGGKLHATHAHRFEVVFGAETVAVYVYDAQGTPVSAKGVTGRADLAVARQNPARTPLRRATHQSTGGALSYQAAKPEQGRLRDRLIVKHGVGEAAIQGVRVDVKLSNLAGEPEGKVEFRIEFVDRVQAAEWNCPKDGCLPASFVFVDPGTCPKCQGELRSTRGAGKGEPGAGRRSGDDDGREGAESDSGADDQGAEPEDDEGRRRRPRLPRRRG